MFVVISASPNADGLTAACCSAALAGIEKAGGQGVHIDLNREQISSCLVCNDGWGTCGSKHHCVVEDCLPAIQEQIAKAEGVFIITPVYWWEPSEPMRYFLCRFRRCEAFKGQQSAAAGKVFHMVAAAGGSGNGTVDCLHELETWCRHVRGTLGDRIGVTRYNREYMLKLIEDAGVRLVSAKEQPSA